MADATAAEGGFSDVTCLDRFGQGKINGGFLPVIYNIQLRYDPSVDYK
jgi:hypothetical protein